MAVTLSESAARHVSNFIAKRGKGFGIRLACACDAIERRSPDFGLSGSSQR